MGGFIVTLGGQDITAYVDPLALSIESVLGQGPGVISGTSGRATTAAIIASLGPAGSALGAGSPLPIPYYVNLFSPGQAEASDVTQFQAHNLSTIALDTTTTPWEGASSVQVVCDALHTFEGVTAVVPSTTLVPGSTVTLSVYLKGNVGGETVHLLLWQQSPDSGIGSSVSATLTTSWQRFSVTATLPTTLLPTGYGLQLNNGGTQACTYWVDGLQMEASSSANPWLDGGIQSCTPYLLRQGELIVYDTTTSTRMFGGYVSKLSDLTMRKQPMVQVDCHDYWQDLDRVQVNLVYNGVSDTTIISQVMSTYAPWIDTSLVNFTVSNYVFQLRRFRAKSVMQILQAIADVTGFDVWVDPNKKLHYQAPSSLGTAAFAVSDNPDGVTSFGAVFSKYEVDDNAIVNRAFFYGGKKPSTDFTQDLSNQCTGSNTLFTVAYYPRNSSDGKVHVKKNGTDLAVGNPFGTGAANTLKSAGGTADVLLDVDAQTLTFDTAPLATDTIVAIYRYNTPLLVTLNNTQSQAFYGRFYDGNLIDDQVFDVQTAIQRLRILLVEQAFGLVEISFTTRQPGLVAGTQLSITNHARGINGTYMIQKVTTKPIGGGYYDFEVECGAWNWHLADVLLAATKFLSPQDDSTDESTTPIQAQQVTTNIGVHVTATATVTGSGTYVYGTGKYGFATYG
jgi:hypothetical protein